MSVNGKLPKVGLAAAGLVAGVVLAGTVGANAATSSPTTTGGATSSSTAADPHPGDNGADGVPESQEHHGGAHGLSMSGAVAAVGTNTVTIGSKTYKVASTSDIDKNGESTLSKLASGDAVTFSLESDGVTIDKLHAGSEAQDAPSQSTTTPSATSTGT